MVGTATAKVFAASSLGTQLLYYLAQEARIIQQNPLRQLLVHLTIPLAIVTAFSIAGMDSPTIFEDDGRLSLVTHRFTEV